MDKNTNYSTLVLMILKEIRLDRGIHQGAIADRIGKTPSAWTKIENGQSILTFDVLVGACSVLQFHFSQVTGLMEKLIPILNSNGYYFQINPLNDEDNDLLSFINQYYKSSGYESLKLRPFDRVSVESFSNPFSFSSNPTIVRYCCEPAFKEWMDNGAKGEPPLYVWPSFSI